MREASELELLPCEFEISARDLPAGVSIFEGHSGREERKDVKTHVDFVRLDLVSSSRTGAVGYFCFSHGDQYYMSWRPISTQ